jgi:hypothetical protein
MPDDPLQQVLQLVADGRLTAEEAEPILHALETGRRAGDVPPPPQPPDPPSPPGTPRFARIEVTEGGRRAVNLRIPLSLGRRALSAIPGLSAGHADDVEEAISRGLHGPIVDVSDEDGDGVRIVLE